MPRIKLAILLLIGLSLAVLLAIHAPFMNGPYYWKWPWRRIDGWRYFPAMLLCAAPLFAAVFVYGARRARSVGAILLVMMSMLAMQIVHIGMTVKPFNLDRIIYFVESPMSTSYYADAIRSMDVSVSELIAKYPEYMPQFYMHSQEKPPGPILFFRAIVQWFGVSDRTAMIAGVVIGVLATLNVPAVYWLIRTLTNDRNAAFAGCVMLVLCPGLTLHFPMLDQLYPAITCLLLSTWAMALRSGKLQWAIAFGVILSAACFVVYHFLVLGAFLGVATVALLVRSPEEFSKVMARSLLAALGTVTIIYFALYVVTGFNAVTVFRTALVEQQKHLASLVRPYPRTILFDLTDFALGAGWMPCALAIMALLNRQLDRPVRGWAGLSIGNIVLLASLGLMQAETARIWCFMLPLLILPASAELARWPRTAQVIVYSSMWLVLCVVGQNLTFMY